MTLTPAEARDAAPAPAVPPGEQPPAAQPHAEQPPGFDKLVNKLSQVAVIAVIWLVCSAAAEILFSQLKDGVKDRPLLFYGLRLAVYIVPYGLAAWGVHRFARPELRRKYWIALALALAVNVSPVGMLIFALILLMSLPIYLGPM